MTQRQWLVLGSYFFLLLIFIGGVIMVAVVPSLAGPFSIWLGPIFAVLGAHLIHFRYDHAGIWSAWGGPAPGAFLMVGLFFIGVGVFFLFGTLGG